MPQEARERLLLVVLPCFCFDHVIINIPYFRSRSLVSEQQAEKSCKRG